MLKMEADAQEKGIYTMLPMDAPIAISPTITIVAAAKADSSSQKIDRVLGVCVVISNNGSTDWDSAAHMIGPIDDVRIYLGNYENRKLGDHTVSGKLLALTNPKNGSLVLRDESGTYSYVPKEGFFGTDNLTATVEFAGYTVKLLYTFKVINSNVGGDETYKAQCGRDSVYLRISRAGKKANGVSMNSIVLTASKTK